ncbi:hypothetical protein KTE69_22465 [Burkholderia multivorans]|nr:hypothetical protein [Burkholderia multivorans]
MNFVRIVIDRPPGAWARFRSCVVDGADTVNAAYQSNFVAPDTFSVRFSIPLVMHSDTGEHAGLHRNRANHVKRNAGAVVRGFAEITARRRVQRAKASARGKS